MKKVRFCKFELNQPELININIIFIATKRYFCVLGIISTLNQLVFLCVQASEQHLKKHYADLAGKPFFPGLVKYMSSGPVVPMVWEGLNAVKTGRQMLGATNPADSAPGTIRGDYCIQIGRNILHGSDGVESAKKEIDVWFTCKEIVSWSPAAEACVYEDQLLITLLHLLNILNNN